MRKVTPAGRAASNWNHSFLSFLADAACYAVVIVIARFLQGGFTMSLRAASRLVLALLCCCLCAPLLSADAPAKQTLAGKCVDDAGQPVASVKLELFRMSRGRTDIVACASLTTGQDGLYRFENLERGTDEDEIIYYLLARRPGYSSASHQFNFLLGRLPETVTLSQKIGTLLGRVTDEQGRPIKGALVSGASFGFEPIQQILAAETDEKGRYAISDMQAFQSNSDARIYFWVNHPDYPQTRASYSSIPSDVDVTLPKGGVIEGTVTDAVTGMPAASTPVVVQGVKGRGSAMTKTDTQGKYRLVLTPDLYNIRATGKDRTCFCVDSFDVRNGAKSQVNLELIEGGLIVGRVTDESGKPLSRLGATRIQIGHHGPAFPRSGAAVGGTRVEEDGSYRLRVAPGDNYPYIMHDVSTERSPRSAFKHDPIRVAPGQEVQLEMTVITGK